MSKEELAGLFTGQAQAEDSLIALEEDGSDLSADDFNEDAAMMEAENLLLHEIQQGPAAHVDDEWEAEGLGMELAALDIPVVAVGADPVIDDEDYIMEEEVLWEPTSKAPAPFDDLAPLVSSAPSSSSKGLNTTPLEVRRSIPPNSKLQRKKAKTEGKSSGWQAWPFTGAVSRWFSFGPGGHYDSPDSALQAATNWLWEQAG